MTAAETEEGEPSSPESPEEPEMPETEEDGGESEDHGEEADNGQEVDEPDIYEFAEESGYTAGDLQPAYQEIEEDSYQLDEDSEKVLIGASDWENIEGMLSAEEEETGEPDSWTDMVKSYLFDHDTEYTVGGATGLGAGILTASLGYTLAGGLLATGGSAALGWGLGNILGDKITEYVSDEETLEEPEESEEETEIEHELDEYSEWEVEIVDEEAYGQAVEEYLQQTQ